LPKRWIVERTFAWISRNRRLARDFERYAATAVAFFRLAMIRIMMGTGHRPWLKRDCRAKCTIFNKSLVFMTSSETDETP
jgi:Transposase DDE domain